MCKIEPNWGDSQAGRPRPGRPAGLPLPHFAMRLHGELLEPKVKSQQGGFGKIHNIRSKGLNQVELRSNPVTNRRTRAQLNL